MIATIRGGRLSGTIRAVTSKSCAHRLLICAALSDAPTEVEIETINADIEATARCLNALGAEVKRTESGYRVAPADVSAAGQARLDCGESGSTLRFLLPVTALYPRGSHMELTGSDRLPERPNTALTEAMRLHGAAVSADFVPLTVEGPMKSGRYELPGNISSQYISGLLFALPLLEGDSQIRFTTEVESGSYIDLTLAALRVFGVSVQAVSGGYDIPGGQVFRSPGVVRAEGDWSNAAFWLAARALGSDIQVTGLDPDSAQGDRAVMRVLEEMRGADGKLVGCRIDAADIPDLVPVLAVAATQAAGETVFVNAGRLRIKECDRLHAMRENLTKLGACVEETEDGMIIRGRTALHGAEVDSFNDHRIAMAMAVAATVAEGEIVIRDAGAVAKSYPSFYRDFISLGGVADLNEREA